jgi:hypothetical protein
MKKINNQKQARQKQSKIWCFSCIFIRHFLAISALGDPDQSLVGHGVVATCPACEHPASNPVTDLSLKVSRSVCWRVR